MNGRITTELDGFSLSLSNLDKPLFPDGFTKGELMSYYLEIAEVLLPHLDGRPLTRVRFPDGTAGESFYEKNAPAGAPEFVRTVDVATSAGTVRYVTATRRADLAWLANLAAIELHTPQWRAQEATAGPHGIRLDGDDEPLATSLIVDLDPGPGVAAPDLARGAILAATALADVGLESHCKTSGNKGLQLTVPIAPTPASEVYELRPGAGPPPRAATPRPLRGDHGQGCAGGQDLPGLRAEPSRPQHGARLLRAGPHRAVCGDTPDVG